MHILHILFSIVTSIGKDYVKKDVVIVNSSPVIIANDTSICSTTPNFSFSPKTINIGEFFKNW